MRMSQGSSWWRLMALAAAVMMFLMASSLLPVQAYAQDDVSDHGSRAARRAERDDETNAEATSPDTQAGEQPKARKSKTKRKKKRKKKKKKSPKKEAQLYVAYNLGAFVGRRFQVPKMGVLTNETLEGGIVADSDSLSLELSHGFDPFSTKTFNFPEEDDTTAESRARLTQPTHELAATLRHRHDWSSLITSKVRVRADRWLPALRFDERRSLRLEPSLTIGEKRGLYGEIASDGFYKVFPQYEVADRKLDQVGADSTVEVGYTFEAYTRIAVGAELDYTKYLDARYDVLNADGTLSRATRSKVYFERSPFLSAAWRPFDELRTKLRYAYELNDATDYNRRMTGRVDGELIAKFIPDYYDYRRHRIESTSVIQPLERLRFDAMAEVWFRDFDNYEARGVDNEWLGETRADVSLELGLEARYRVWDFELLGLDHGLMISAFGSHLQRRSNMKREVSIATNFDLTRAFLGLEVETL